MVGQDIMRLLQKLADIKPVDSSRKDAYPEFTSMRRTIVGLRDQKSLKNEDMESKEVVRTLGEKIQEEILKQTTLRRKKVPFQEEAEELGLDQEFGE